jgi:cupin superfamily acireductone dioxygenase involved in methionine salvage
MLNFQIGFFSGSEFNVDLPAGLSGYCDYILTASKESYEIRTPVVTLAEVKHIVAFRTMPRKKSIKKSAQEFKLQADAISTFLMTVSLNLSEQHISWLYNYAIIRLYREFEILMLDALVGAINNDTTVLTATSGISFPKHLNDEVCEFLITGTGYFDFKGRDGLIKTLKKFVPDSHYLLTLVKKPIYKDALEQLSALRNFAAHESIPSKTAVLKALRRQRIHSSGAWLKQKGRFPI